MKYRPEIDGLRALAVIPVILFHAGFKLFGGGFVGVDVFFVISGYLITTIIVSEIEQGSFSIVNFYERRARRILPALFLVMLFCFPFVWFFLVPKTFEEFSKSLIAVSLFFSNILFWKESGYFANASAEKPLLHTWSLAVEEQYYFFFPLFMMLFWKLGKRRLTLMLGLIFCTSIIFAHLFVIKSKEQVSFYLLPARVWELLLGSFVALYLLNTNRKEPNKILNEIGGCLGIFLVLFAVFSYTKKTPFPGLYALVPTIGAALVILCANQNTVIGRLVGNRGFVGIGLVSYSAYLWHQPLFAFAKIKLGKLNHSVAAFLILLITFLAYITWRFVEAPFRKKENFSRLFIFKICLFFILIFCLSGVLGIYSKGFVSRFVFYPNEEVSEERLKAVFDQYGFTLYPKPKLAVYDLSQGISKIGTGDRGILFVGDSHSEQYYETFDFHFSKNATLGEKTTVFLNPVRFPVSISDLKLNQSVEVVVFSFFWAHKYRSPTVNTYIRCCGDGPKGVIGVHLQTNSLKEMNSIDESFARLLDQLRERKVRTMIVLDNPFGEEVNPQSLLKVEGRKVSPSKYFQPLNRKTAILRAEPVRSRLLKLAKEHGAEILDPFDYLCNEKFCPMFSKNGYTLYKDYDHLSLEALKNEASYILSVMDKKTK